MKVPVARFLNALRERRPLVHNITNFVVMNSTANALLAAGASPVMAHAAEEVAEMAALADALVLNIGTLEPAWVESMLQAGRAAARKKIPIVLDPVGAGATALRTGSALRILNEIPITILRGNPSEIMALAGGQARTRGVDAAAGVDAARDAARLLAGRHNLVTAVTGEVDFVTDSSRALEVANGHILLTRVTGTGCMASALVGAFAAVAGEQWMEAAAAALAFLGVCAERAAVDARGPASFEAGLRDMMFTLTGEEADTGAKIREA